LSNKRFRIAFSFAGEKRTFVAQVAALLSGRFGEAAILYDKYHEAEFARARLGRYLPKLYLEEADLVVVVICGDYSRKEWPGLEWDAVFDLLKNRKEADVMLCRFDHATVEGLFSDTGYVELDDKTTDETANLILQRLAINEGKPRDAYLSGKDSATAPTQGGEPPPPPEDRRQALRQRATQLASRSRKSPAETNAYYFYISRDKLQKLEQAPPKKTRTLDPTISGVLSTVGTSHGRTTEYRDWSRRLAKVLETLGQATDIQDLREANLDPRPGWAYAEIDLKLVNVTKAMATLQGRLGDIEIMMSCSIVGFLDFDPNTNDLIVTSTNHWFFGLKHSYRFRTHLLVLSIDPDGKTIRTSPLYLALPLGLLEP